MSRRNGRTKARPWVPMQRAVPIKKSPEKERVIREFCAERGLGDDAIEDLLNPGEVWKNDRYTAHVERREDGSVKSLSIKRNDRKPAHDWRHFQQIKNDIAGEEIEAVELYPAMSRLMDTSNQYWTWALPPGQYLLGDEGDYMAKPGPKRIPLEVRFWGKVAVADDLDACWLWTGARTRDQYGQIQRGGDGTGQRPLYAHRLAYAIANGLDYDDIPNDLEVRHTCDSPPCCNPRHLLLGTSKDNKADAAARDRAFWQRAKRLHGRFVAERGDESEELLWCARPGEFLELGFPHQTVADADDPIHERIGSVQRELPDEWKYIPTRTELP